MYFNHGSEEIVYLIQKDNRLADVIDKIGKIKRPADTDLFSSVIHHISSWYQNGIPSSKSRPQVI